MPTPSPAPAAFHRATITRIVRETADTTTYTLRPHSGDFSYRAGQFCTFRVQVDGRHLLRSYSMSSAPETDGELMTTVKRVPGGKVSNWLGDHAREGDTLELTQPRGRFCLRESEVPLLGFAAWAAASRPCSRWPRARSPVRGAKSDCYAPTVRGTR